MPADIPNSPPNAGAGLSSLRSILAPRDDEIVGPVRSLANRWSYFFRRERNLERWHSVRGAYTLQGEVDHGALQEAALQINAHHDGLRLQGIGGISGWKEVIVSTGETSPFLYRTLSGRFDPSAALLELAEQVAALSIFPGGLFHVVYLRAPSEHLLTFFFHHLLVDQYSIDLVVRDFFSVYEQLLAARKASLPRKTTSYQAFCYVSAEYWMLRAQAEAKAWQSYPWDRIKSLKSTNCLDDTSNIERHTVRVGATLPVSQHDLLRLQRERGWRPAELMLAAIARAYARWSGHSLLHLALVVHGRESFLAEVDLSRTVGWISETVPVLLDGDQSWSSLLSDSRAQLRQASTRGKGYGVLKYLSPDPHDFNKHPCAEISLNMSPIKRAPPASSVFARDVRYRIQLPDADTTKRVFNLSGGIYAVPPGDLVLAWDFSNKIFDEERVRAFLSGCVLNVEELISYLTSTQK